ncbi:MAG: hypothetical protein ABI359_08600 [Ginsengibacter sp.]
MAETLNISDIQLFNLLKPKLGEKEAQELVLFVRDEVVRTVVEKQQIITKDIEILREEMRNKFEEMRNEFSKIATKNFVESKIAEAKFQIILWAFVFWVTQLGAIFAFLKLFIE